MPSAIPPLPAWEGCGFRNHDLARVVEALSEVRSHAVAWYPHVLTGCELGSQFGQIGMLAVGAIIRLWDAWPRFGGDCAACGAPVRGVGGGGLINRGALTGVCGCCGLVQSRWIRGCGVIATEAREILAGTPCQLVRVEGRSRDFVPLIAVLHELGASGLPSPRARGLRARGPGEKRRDYGTPRQKRD